jgi:predicted DNA-binding transcriptional regulator YafY
MVSPTVISEIEEWLGVECVVERGADGVVVRAELPIDGGLISKVLSYGKSLRVIGPNALKERVLRSAAEIVELYQ